MMTTTMADDDNGDGDSAMGSGVTGYDNDDDGRWRDDDNDDNKY